ncbi:methionine--tRNA ligase [Fonticella tunisiensis]|uniref:Methionine--tRNA ligase n=1 Tax=Fonticella tunisiensis TaxID=1096341 RepID=A0A4R7K964_9CLOT|nr:methionine--tRNA ligase [Fonticella tunisiensis]TDT50558.1 methionyl-tRNA synthetase [Fonticella tunisiensis]
MEKKTYYITTPIYYPSNKLHIGNAYTTVAADAMARFKRLTGYDVMFLTGTDEHGQKIERIAKEKGTTPKAYVDEIVAGIKDLWKLLNISYDRFIRTTDDYHERAVQEIFKKLYEKGDIYKGHYEGWYCTPCESFFTETQLVDGKCPDCGRPVELTKEEAYFFRMSKYQDRLLKHIEEHPDFIQPESRKNEMINNFLKPGLEDLCVSRTSFKWGIPVTFDENHVIYVWVDALSNYITALGYGSDDDTLYRKYWPADVHLVGKDIIRFHTIIWPIMLMALDLPLPKQVFGHGWLLVDGGKMSKSKGNVVDPVVLADHFGVDAIRYYLLREIPFGSDGLYNNEMFIKRINSDLANDLGNLVSRTLTMIEKYFGGVITEGRFEGEFDESLRKLAVETHSKVESLVDRLRISDAMDEIWKLISRANKYIDETMPWVLAKDEAQRDRLAGVLYNLTEAIRIVSILISSFMPDTSRKINEQFNFDADILTWDSIKEFGKTKTGVKVQRGELLFPRIDVEKKLAELDKIREEAMKQAQVAEKPKMEPIKEEITIDDFSKIDLRVVKVVECERIKGADKLLKLKVDLGGEIRQVVSGIAKHFTPEELVGKQVILVANLKPVKLRGVDSYGMILAASTPNKEKLLLATVDGEIETGAQVK